MEIGNLTRHTVLIGLIGLGILAASAGQAQNSARPSIEVDFDVRARLAGVGKSGAEWHSGLLRLSSALGPGLRMEAYGVRQYQGTAAQQFVVEKQWGTQRAQLGIVRVPFGIYDVRETYASGLIDYPLPRGDYYYNSVDWGAPGVSWSAGSPKLQWELAGFGGRGTGIWDNRAAIGGGALRAQTYTHGLILGASHWSGYFRYGAGTGTRQNVSVNGVDLRFTRPHLLLRGEYLFGGMGDKQNLRGGYLDLYYHLPKFEKWTLAARVEQFKPSDVDGTARQITLGVRYAATPQWTLAVNWRRNNNNKTAYAPAWTSYAGRGGDWLFQAYHRLKF